MDNRITDQEFLHDFYVRMHRAAELHPSPDWSAYLRKAAERTREAFQNAHDVAQNARRVAGVSNADAYLACSTAQSAAVRVLDAIENQVF